MRWSKLFIPTLREDPAEAKNATHRLLIRAGYMRRQDYLFLGRRLLRKLVAMIRQELDTIGAQEMLVSSPKAMLAIAAEIRGYKQLPQIWYQFDGFKVEGWSFHLGGDSAKGCVGALRKILARCGLNPVETPANFLIPSEEGEAVVRGNDYAMPFDRAQSTPRPPLTPDPDGDLSPEQFHTPGRKTIADLSAFTGLPETSQMKSVVMVADRKPILVMLRGDHQLSEAKLQLVLAATDLRAAGAEEIREWFGADAGSLGPVGVKNMRVLADGALRGRQNMVCGANRNDYHLRYVTPGEDFDAEFHDLRRFVEGDTSIVDDQPLLIEKALILAAWHWRDGRPWLVHLEDPGGSELAGSGMFAISMDQILRAVVAHHQDADGLALPPAIAPFAVVITPVF